MIMYDAVLFDLDGTLTDPKEGITKCVRYALDKMGIKEENLDNLLCFIGPPLADSFKDFCNMTEKDALRAVEYYRERFSEKGILENKPIDGITELLSALKEKNMTVALATSEPLVFARRVLDNFALTQYFDIVVGATLDGTLSEKKDVIAAVLKQLPNAENPVMVGDRRQDVIGAKLCGIPCIGVRFGYAEENELEEAGADKIAATPRELYTFLTE